MVVRRIAMNLDTWDRLDRDGREQSVGRRLSDGAPLSSGLVFIAFQADVDAQYVPLQRRLDELDLLNEWTTPIGSAVFAIPPGCAEGGCIGETLLA